MSQDTFTEMTAPSGLNGHSSVQPDENEAAAAPEESATAVSDGIDGRGLHNHPTDGVNHTPGEVSPAPVGDQDKPSPRINPDDPRFIRAITAGVGFAGLVAFAISFVALMEVAAWLGLPGWMHWAVPAFIDIAILVYAGSVLIHKARGEKTWPSWLMLGAFTILSVIANTAHALSYAGQLEAQWQAIIGAVIAGMVPVAVFTATEQLARVAVEDPISRRRELEAQAEWAAAQADRERYQLEVEAERETARQEAELAREEHRNRLEEIRAQRPALAQRAVRRIESDHPTAEATNMPASRADRPPHAAGETVPAESPGGSSGGSSPRSTVDMAELVEFVSTRVQNGGYTSGADIAAEFGCSDKTGRRHLAKLRKERPEIFPTKEEEAA